MPSAWEIMNPSDESDVYEDYMDGFEQMMTDAYQNFREGHSWAAAGETTSAAYSLHIGASLWEKSADILTKWSDTLPPIKGGGGFGRTRGVFVLVGCCLMTFGSVVLDAVM
jgi:hypothetical protein